MLIKPFHDPYAVRHDGTTDLTGDWTISTNSITLTAGTLTASTLHATSRIDVGADDAIAHLYIHDAGTIVMYDDSDDTSVTIGPVANGTSTMGLTGSLHVSDSIGIGRSPTLDFDVYDDEVDFGLESTKTTSGGGYTRMRFNAAGKAGQAANTRNFAVNNANADSTHNENKLTYQARNDDNTYKHDLFAIHHGGVVEFGKIDRAANMPMKLLTAAGYDSSILFAESNETIGAKLVYDGGDDKFYLKTYNNPTEYIPIAVTRTGVIDFALGFKIVADSQKIILGADDDAEIYYDGSKLIIDDTINQTISLADNNLTTTGGVTAGASTFGDGGTTDYSQFEADGTLEFNGAATVWKDANVGAAMLSKPAASQPTETQFVDEAAANTGIYALGFAVGDKVSGTIEIPHDYKEGSDLTFHVHWQGAAAPTGTDYVQWRLTYTVGVVGATLDATATMDTADTAVTQYNFNLTDFAAITGTNYNIGEQFLFTLERVAATGDAYAGVAIVATVGFHYEVDTVGSRQIITK